MTEVLFKPFDLAGLILPNRVVMPPMTRARAAAGQVPTDMMAKYYAQRATAGLIITEGTQISAQGQGYAWTPGIDTAEQVEGLKKVTAAVHGSRAASKKANRNAVFDDFRVQAKKRKRRCAPEFDS